MDTNMKESKIIYVDNKPHIKCGVVMLSTNKEDNVSICKPEQDKLFYVYDWNGYGTGYHLYIISDEEIKEGDWVLLPNNKIHKMSHTDMIHYLDSQSKATKKIIATTDTSLGLPQPSQQFIEKFIEEYNRDNVITEVLVEVEEYEFKQIEWFQEAPYTHKYKMWKLKLDSQNQITIRKQKDSWSREEVEKLLLKHQSDYRRFVRNTSPLNWSFDISKWIKENLI